MQLTIEIPDDVAQVLQREWKDLPRHVLETLAVEGYRTGVLTAPHARRLLGLQSRMEVDALLKRAGVSYEYTENEIDNEIELSRQLVEKRHRELHS